ncbi:MAG: DinB family protein [Saprospiraceae bacterium]
MKKYRDNGAIGALLDEYEKAIEELKMVLQPLSLNELVTIVDHETQDKDCESIQTILTHVVRAGYTYVISIRKWLGETIDYKEKETLSSIAEYSSALDEMFLYNVQLFEDYPNIKLEEYDVTKKIKVRWGQSYDVDQLLEHAIVHILRHRRQIERFLIILNE